MGSDCRPTHRRKRRFIFKCVAWPAIEGESHMSCPAPKNAPTISMRAHWVGWQKMCSVRKERTCIDLHGEAVDGRSVTLNSCRRSAPTFPASRHHLVSAWFQAGAAYVGLNVEYVSPNPVPHLSEGCLAATHHRAFVRPGLGHPLVRHKLGTRLRILRASRSTGRSLSSRGALCREEDSRDGH